MFEVAATSLCSQLDDVSNTQRGRSTSSVGLTLALCEHHTIDRLNPRRISLLLFACQYSLASPSGGLHETTASPLGNR